MCACVRAYVNEYAFEGFADAVRWISLAFFSLQCFLDREHANMLDTRAQARECVRA